MPINIRLSDGSYFICSLWEKEKPKWFGSSFVVVIAAAAVALLSMLLPLPLPSFHSIGAAAALKQQTEI